MLVLTRKVGQEILLNDNIRISIHRIQGSRVRIAIDAPNDVAILRGELVFDCSSISEPTDQEQVVEANLCCAS